MSNEIDINASLQLAISEGGDTLHESQENAMITDQMACINLDEKCATTLMDLLERTIRDGGDPGIDLSKWTTGANDNNVVLGGIQPEKMSQGDVAEEDEKEEQLLEEDSYIPFGPGGDPGPEHRREPGEEDEPEEPCKYWREEDDYDSCDSYFEEDFYGDFDF